MSYITQVCDIHLPHLSLILSLCVCVFVACVCGVCVCVLFLCYVRDAVVCGQEEIGKG